MAVVFSVISGESASWCEIGRKGLATIVLAGLCGCTELGYYAQSIEGHLDIMGRRQPVEVLMEGTATDERLRRRLRLAQEIRTFASERLGLPDNRSYRDYVDVGRRYVVWNVVVAPELSLSPKGWCFPVIGCVSYRGYYDEAQARAFARKWGDDGYDVAVGGVRAYSTLGWFDDPLLSTMLSGSETYLAGIVFHELAHQVVYIDDDTAFNEAFAVAVEREGVKRWLAARAPSEEARAAIDQNAARQTRHRAFLALVGKARKDLAKLYASGRPAAKMRAGKRARLDALTAQYAALRAAWGGYSGYDAWFGDELNNAKLALLATYWDKVPAFEQLLASNGGDLPQFYTEVARIGALPRVERDATLAQLQHRSAKQ